ncbi:hypothetical protein SprV_0902710500 [Sparganum proliferum]
MEEERVSLTARVTATVGIFSIMLTLGYIGTQSNMSPYTISYLRKHVDPALSNSHVVWLSAATLVAEGGFMPVSELLLHMLGFRVIVLISCVIYRMFEDEDVLQRIPRSFLIIGGILLGIQLISCKIVQLKPTGDSDSIEIPSVSIDLQSDLPDALNVVPVEKKIRPPELFKMPDIYILWGIMFLSLLPLTLVTSATKIPLYINNLLYSILLATFPFVITVPTAGRYLYAIWVMLMHSCIGGFFVLMPLAVSRTFGDKYFVSNYGLLFTAFVSRNFSAVQMTIRSSAPLISCQPGTGLSIVPN